MKEYIQRFAAGFGVDDIKASTWMPNTRRALAMAEFARDQGTLDKFRSLTMDAYWIDGKDIEDDAILKNLAAASGLNPEQAILAANKPRYLKRVSNTRLEYKQVGVGGIPAFAFGIEIVEGCQQYEVLASAALRAGVKLK